MSDRRSHPSWDHQPDGSRTRVANGIRIVDRGGVAAGDAIEHLVAHDAGGGQVVILGLNASCRPVYTTTLFGYL